jgi:hypothetical protein
MLVTPSRRALRDLLASRSREDPLAQEVEVRAAEHLAFDHFDAVNRSLNGHGAIGQAPPGSQRRARPPARPGRASECSAQVLDGPPKNPQLSPPRDRPGQSRDGADPGRLRSSWKELSDSEASDCGEASNCGNPQHAVDASHVQVATLPLVDRGRAYVEVRTGDPEIG